jgi:hypothetical protein
MLINFRLLLSFALFFFFLNCANGKDYFLTGIVTDEAGRVISDATVSMTAGNMHFRAVTDFNGHYSMRLSGIYGNISGLIEPGTPYPNPFFTETHIPFIINESGDVRFSVYTLSGKKICEINFPAVEPGSYNIRWDGSGTSGQLLTGLYIYAVTFRGETISGRLIRMPGGNSYSGTTLESVMSSPVSVSSSSFRLRLETTVTGRNYFPLRLTDITVAGDTTIDFELSQFNSLPFRTQGNHIAIFKDAEYHNLILKGINLGSSPPGYFPGEIAYAITPSDYEKWIRRMGEAGFNSIRVYTLHPPVFYEKLAEYNYRHPGHPILLFQGIWLSEVESRSSSEFDLTLRTASFSNDIKEVIDCMHGNRSIEFRPGRAYGNYKTDITRWIAGYVIGREISPQEVETTNMLHPGLKSYTGYQFGINQGSAAEAFAAAMLDETAGYEDQKYSMRHPVSMSSWPTLDPLVHPTETTTDEDIATIDIIKITGKNEGAGLFATYHAYPYYPNFVSLQPSYQAFSDSQGPDSYAGYLADLQNHYSGIPLVIGEFGVPSSWGSAHQSFSNLDHGGYSEVQQGEKNLRMMHNIIDAGCAGGFMFAWMDEWFKPTWIVQYLEALGFSEGNNFIPTRQLWHNITSPEQNFGLLSFEQVETLPFVNYVTDNTSGPVQSISATNDNRFFFVNVTMKERIAAGDTLYIAFDTYSSGTGESKLPDGSTLRNRSEFLLSFIAGDDTAKYSVAEAYDMNGLTPRFNLSDQDIQKYRSVNSDLARWKLMQWINDETTMTTSDIGLLPVENSSYFTEGQRCAVAWSGNKIKIRIPWTMLYYYDPTRMQVIDGASSDDGGWTFSINSVKSDGIGVSVGEKGIVTSTMTRYNWSNWLIVPLSKSVEKKSLQVVETGFSSIPDFAN